MVLSPLQSWLLLVILFGGVVGVLYVASRPSWMHRRAHRSVIRDLDDLRRLEDARARLGRMNHTNPGHVRLGHKDTGNTND